VLEAPDPESHRHDDGEEETAMGVAITIGHAEEIETGDSEIPSYLGVRPVEREDAPAFDLDEHTGRSNRRDVSYVAWDRFCRQTGLRDLFFDPRSGLMREHPGCAPITFEHVATARAPSRAGRRAIRPRDPAGATVRTRTSPGSSGSRAGCIGRSSTASAPRSRTGDRRPLVLRCQSGISNRASGSALPGPHGIRGEMASSLTKTPALVSAERITKSILLLRGEKVILDADLASKRATWFEP
jgi:hypothetical protein